MICPSPHGRESGDGWIGIIVECPSPRIRELAITSCTKRNIPFFHGKGHQEMILQNAQNNILDSEIPPLNDFFPPFTRGEMMRRRNLVATGMADQSFDALIIWGGLGIVFGTSPGQTNLMWLTNYSACMQGYLIVSREADLTLIIRFAAQVQNAKDITFIDDIRGNYVIEETVVDRLKELKVDRGRIGIVGPHVGRPATRITIPVEHHRIFTESLPNATFQNASDWYEALRIVRSEEEINLLRKAGKLGDSIYKQMIESSRPGATNRDLRRLVNVRCAEEGATYVFAHIGSFHAKNPSNYADYYPTDRRISAGDRLMTELCVGYGNYWNKIWGTWFCGEPTEEYRQMYEDAREIHNAVVSAARPGMRGAEFDEFAQTAAEKGYEVLSPIIHGWSSINHDPAFGSVPDTKAATMSENFRDWVLRAGETYTVVGRILKLKTGRGLWVGSSGVITKNGYESFNSDVTTSIKYVKL
jgi:Xaa-Pro dipeptidase